MPGKMARWPGTHELTRRARRRCCRRSGGCGCRCPGQGCRTGMPGRSQSGDGIVLFDTGMGGKGRLRQLDLASAQAGLRGRGHRPARLHPLPHRPLRARRLDRRGGRLRALDAPRLGARAAARRRPGGGARAPARGRPPERRPGRRAGALPRVPQRTRKNRHRRDPGARPRARPRGRGRDRPRHLAGPRDARPRPLARRPAPARAQADDLRRPPARPHRALLRPRPHARPGRRIPLQPRARSSRSTIELCLPGHGRPFRDPEAKIAEARRQVDELLGKVREALAGRRADGLRDRRRDRRPGEPRQPRPAPGSCRSSSPASTTWRSTARSSRWRGATPNGGDCNRASGTRCAVGL